ncbi:MAG: DUF6483 family protein [Verrucomicrobiales bacterium]|nr:DUF6483 family protein [Verrucomicrobiales bacterium]
MAEFHENGGRFSLAEEHWFVGTLDSPDRKSILQSFYRRMLSLPDEDIEAGDLTRAEILDSREELQ